MPRKRRKLDKDFERIIYSSQKKIELILAKIFDISDEDIQKEYMSAFRNVVELFDSVKDDYAQIGFSDNSTKLIETYFEAISKVIKKGNQALIMLPEISLTEQWLQKFYQRFGVEPILWHSSIGKKDRVNAWKKISTGQVKVVVGARSSLFLPFKNLDLNNFLLFLLFSYFLPRYSSSSLSYNTFELFVGLCKVSV